MGEKVADLSNDKLIAKADLLENLLTCRDHKYTNIFY